MPAASNAELLNYEKWYEDAVAEYLLALPSTPFAQVFTPRTRLSEEAIIETPRAFVSMSIVGTGEQENQRATDGAWYLSHKIAQMSIQVVVRRDDATQDIGALRGRVRVAMLEATAMFNGTSVPHYQTLFVRENGGSGGINEVNDEIITNLSYAVEFHIKPDAWALS